VIIATEPLTAAVTNSTADDSCTRIGLRSGVFKELSRFRIRSKAVAGRRNLDSEGILSPPSTAGRVTQVRQVRQVRQVGFPTSLTRPTWLTSLVYVVLLVRFRCTRISYTRDYAQQSGAQQLVASGFRARTNALTNRFSTCAASRSTSSPLSIRNERASSIV
jgi:hypothetical protein